MDTRERLKEGMKWNEGSKMNSHSTSIKSIIRAPGCGDLERFQSASEPPCKIARRIDYVSSRWKPVQASGIRSCSQDFLGLFRISGWPISGIQRWNHKSGARKPLPPEDIHQRENRKDVSRRCLRRRLKRWRKERMAEGERGIRGV